MEFYTLCLYVFAALSCYISYGESYTTYKCDPKIMAKIQKLWGKHYPKQILKTAVEKEQDNIIFTSPGFYSSDATCARSTFTFDKTFAPFTTSTIYLTYRNGTKGEITLHLGEYKGTTFDPCFQDRRHYVYSKHGVVAFYICSVAADAICGVPQVLIKVRRGFKKFAVNEAKQDLEELVGISKWTGYPLQCPNNFDWSHPQ